MSELPLSTRVRSLCLVLATVGALLLAPKSEQAWSSHLLLAAVILFGMIVVAEINNISIPYGSSEFDVSVGAAIALGAGITLGPLHGALLVIGAHLTDSLILRREPIKIVVNVSNYGLSTVTSATVYVLIADPSLSPLASMQNLMAVSLAAITFSLINTWTLALIVAPVIGTTSFKMWRSNVGGMLVETISLPALGSFVPILVRENPLAILLLIVPLIGPRLALNSIQRVQRETKATMEALTDALEQRDTYTHRHSIRVTEYVSLILKEMPHIPFETCEATIAASRIHDLGKIGTRDLALNKAGPLTTEERQEMQRHSAIGADIVDRLDVYRHCAAIVRHHHERWDGKGYPDGLQGEEIPIGARIICVADSFDAMTSDRVYRKAMSRDVALAEVRAHSGTQFDPQVVAAFERAMAVPPVTIQSASSISVPANPALANK